jgi:very-short-patch-repair endonuclease
VDFAWSGLVVEVDGYAYHHTCRAFKRDRERDAVLAAHGIRTLRFTARQVTDGPAEVVAALGAVRSL